MLRNLEGWHIVVLLVVIVLVFGASRLPGVAKAAGQSLKIFRNEMKDLGDAKKGDTPPTSTGAPEDGSAGGSSTPKA